MHPNSITAIMCARHRPRPNMPDEIEYRFVSSDGMLIFSGYYTDEGIRQLTQVSRWPAIAHGCPEGSFGLVPDSAGFRIVVWGSGTNPQQLLWMLGKLSLPEARRWAAWFGVEDEVSSVTTDLILAVQQLQDVIDAREKVNE